MNENLREKIKKRFNSSDLYHTFTKNLDDLFVDIRIKYAFLGLKDDIWERLENEAISKYINSLDADKMQNYVRVRIEFYFKKKIEEQNVIIINNLFIMVARQRADYKTLLIRFFRKLDDYGIKFQEDYFRRVKDASLYPPYPREPLIIRALKELGIYDLSLRETKKFLNRSPKLYDNIKCPGYSEIDNRRLVSYVVNLLVNKGSFLKAFNSGIKGEDYFKVKEVVLNYGIILEMYEEFNSDYKESQEDFLKALLLYSRNQIKDIIRLFKETEDRFFLSHIAYVINTFEGRVNKRQEIREETTLEQQYNKRIYNRFPLINGISEQVRNEIVDILLLSLPKEMINTYRLFLNGKVTGNSKEYREVDKYLRILIANYMFYGEDILSIDFKINFDKMLLLYTRFVTQAGMTDEEKIQIIDILFNSKEKDEQDLILKLLSGEIICDSERKKANLALSYIKRHYESRGKIILTDLYGKGQQLTMLWNILSIKQSMSEFVRNQMIDLYREDHESIFYTIRCIILEDFGVKLEDISSEKKQVLGEALKRIEEEYKDLGYTDVMLKRDLKNKLNSLFMFKKYDLETITRDYIEITSRELQEKANRRGIL